MRRLIIIGIKGSDLALLQANVLKKELSEKGFISELKNTETKDIEAELSSKRIDIAVHSLKDLTTSLPKGLVIGGLSERQKPSELLVISKAAVDMSCDLRLKVGAIVGTSSVRRHNIVKDLAAQVTTKDLNENIQGQIQKLHDGECHAIILASDEVNSLKIDLSSYETIILNPKEFAPAPGQGVTAYQCREADIELRKTLSTIHNRNTSENTNVERKVLKLMDGDNHTPLGVYVEKDSNGYFHVSASYASSKNEKPTKVNLSQSTSHQLAEKVVEQLRKNAKS